MEENKKDQKFSQTPQKKVEMPERKREDISSGPKTTSHPEIDLPLQGGKAESDLSSKKTQQAKSADDRSEKSSR